LTKVQFENAPVSGATGTISVNAFKGCTALTSITFYGNSWKVNEGAFSGWTADQTITFADMSEATENFAEGWDTDCAANVVYGVPKAETEPETDVNSELEAEA
jgi:hypothetical protein